MENGDKRRSLALLPDGLKTQRLDCLQVCHWASPRRKRHVTGTVQKSVVRVEVIGIGPMGVGHLGFIQGLGHEVIAVCDREKGLGRFAKRVVPRLPFYDSATEMLVSRPPEAIFICTPAPTHRAIVAEVSSIFSSIPIFLEKPLGISASDASEIVRMGTINNRITMVGFQRRFRFPYRFVKDLLESGVLGELLFYRSHMLSSGVSGASTGWKFEGAGGGVLLEDSCHLIDLLIWYFGEPESVQSQFRSIHTQAEDYVHATFRYTGGLLGEVSACWSMQNYPVGELMIEIQGENGFVNVTDDRVIYSLARSSDVRFPSGRHRFDTARYMSEPRFLLGGHSEQVFQDDFFLNCVKDRVQARPNFLDGARVNSLIDRIRPR